MILSPLLRIVCPSMFQSSRPTTDSPTFQGCAIMAMAAVEEEGEEGAARHRAGRHSPA